MGRALGVGDSQQECKYVNFKYDANSVTQAAYICEFPCRISAWRGRPRVVGSDGSAVSAAIFKCASGVAAASGTALQASGATAYDLKGTADANQTMTLIPDADARTFNAGDSLNVVFTGVLTGAVGVMTFTLDPL